MILSKIILAATMSATVLWLTPIHSNGNNPIHEHCACGHDHCNADCDHEDADHAVFTTTGDASPDAHTGHSAVYAKEKCSACSGKGKVSCTFCGGKGKITRTEFTPCKNCKGTGGIKGRDGKLIVKCPTCVGKGGKSKDVKENCSNCSGKGKVTCNSCGGSGYKF